MKIKLTELKRNFTIEMVKGTFDKLVSLGSSASHFFSQKPSVLQMQVGNMLKDAWHTVTGVKDADAKLARIPVEKRDNRYK